MPPGRKRQVDNKTRKTRACIVIVKDIQQEEHPLHTGKVQRRSSTRSTRSSSVSETQTVSNVKNKRELASLQKTVEEEEEEEEAEKEAEQQQYKLKTAGAAEPLKKRLIVDQLGSKPIATRRGSLLSTVKSTRKELAEKPLSTRRNSVVGPVKTSTLRETTLKSRRSTFVEPQYNNNKSKTSTSPTTRSKSLFQSPTLATRRRRLSSVLRSTETSPQQPTGKAASKAIASDVKSKTAKATEPVAEGTPASAAKISTKMYKQAKAVSATPPPPTIAASRSRRSIKPNPKYASEDIVTPKYVAALATDSHATSSSGKRSDLKSSQRLSQDSDDEFFSKDLDDDFIDDDDDLADEAFKPQSQPSDDDDLSDIEMFANEYVREKHPQNIRRRGRPPKVHPQNVRTTPMASTAQRTGSGAANKGSGTSAPSQLQQLRRTFSANYRANAAALTGGTLKRKALDDTDSENTVARKRFITSTGISNSSAASASAQASSTIISKTSNDGKRYVVRKSMPLMNGINKSTTSAASGGGGGTRLLATPQSNSRLRNVLPSSGNASKAAAANAAAAANKMMIDTPGKLRQRVLPTITRPNSSGGAAASGGGGGSAAAKLEERRNAATRRTAETNTFTIVNIDDIINQDDVLISKMPTKSTSALSSKATATQNSQSTSSSLSTSTSTIAGAVKRTPLSLKSAVGKSAGQQQSQSSSNNNKVNLMSASSNNQNANHKPAPRILNSEVGKKTLPMKPLMNMVDDMAKELCPVMDDDFYGSEEDEDDILDDELQPEIVPGPMQRRSIFRGNKTTNAVTKLTSVYSNRNNNNNKEQLANKKLLSSFDQRRKLASLLCDDEEVVFKKPSTLTRQKTPETHKENTPAATNQRSLPNHHHQQSANATSASAKISAKMTAASIQESITIANNSAVSLPGETTTISCEGGRIVKKVTCYETWHVISVAKEVQTTARALLEIPLIKLANVATRIKLPSERWSSKVTLFKMTPNIMAKQTTVIYTGDLKAHNIPEIERHKYQPSCVLFRRSVSNCRSDSRLPYDRAIIFKNKCFYTNIDGKHVSLVAAPEVINTAKDIEILLDIVDGLTLKSSFVETISGVK